MVYDPSDLLPVEDGSARIGDFEYGEKEFTYEILISLDTPGWDYATAQWNEGVQFCISQTMLAQQQAKTLLIQNDWKPLGNIVTVGKIEPNIDIMKVRSIVGGSLPIMIDPAANVYAPPQ